MIAILPPMVILSRKIPVWADAVVILAGCALARIVVDQSLYKPTEFLAVACWAYCFYVGVALPKVVASLGRHRWILCSGVSAMLSLTLMVGLTVILHSRATWGTKLILDGLLTAPMIAWAHVTTGSIGAKMLRLRPLVVLGDMSYSVYAYGTSLLIPTAIVIVSMFPHSMRTEPRGGAVLTLLCPTVSLVILLPMSWLSYVYIEQKATDLGRRISLAIASLRLRGVREPTGQRSALT
jgi:peptidoglycan/LPS O-acetylase OafA/YrhL